jgi:hypothetical protein
MILTFYFILQWLYKFRNILQKIKRELKYYIFSMEYNTKDT